MPIRLTDIPGLRPTQLNMPGINLRAALAPAEALGDVAEGIASVSTAFRKIAPAIEQKEEGRKELDFKRKWSDEIAKMKEDNANDPDPANQLKRTNELIARMEKDTGSPDYTDGNRARISPWVAKQATTTRIHAGHTASTTANRKGNESFQLSVKSAMQTNNRELLDDTLETGRSKGIISEQEGLVYLQQFDQKQREDGEELELREDPRGWIESNREGPADGNRSRWNRHLKLAQDLGRREFVETDGTIKSLIRDGKITSEEDVARYARDQKPEAIAAWQDHFRLHTDPDERKRLASEDRQHGLVGEATELIRSLDFQGEEYDAGYIRAESLVTSLPEGSAIRNQLERKLDDAREGVRRDDESEESLAIASLDKGMLAEVRQLGKESATGKKESADPEAEDEVIGERMRVHERYGRMQTELASWMKRTPGAKSGEIRERIRQMQDQDERDEYLRKRGTPYAAITGPLPEKARAKDLASLVSTYDPGMTPAKLQQHRGKVQALADRLGLPLSGVQLDALASFDASTGGAERVLAGGERSPQEIAAAMGRYRNRGGKRDPRMENQRQDEQSVFLHGYTSSAAIASSF